MEMEFDPVDQEEADRIYALQDVIQIYASQESLMKSGLGMGGLDTGIDLSQDQIASDWESSENILEKLKSPFPNAQNSYSESLH